jgi:hypothetical protein
MSSRFRRRGAPATLISLLVLVLWAIQSHPVQAQVEGPAEVTFGFAPTDGARWSYSIDDERISDFAGKAPNRAQRTVSDMDYTYEAQPDGTWRVRIIPRTAEMSVDGNAIENPALRLAVGQEVGLRLDKDGVAVQAEGFRALFRTYEREMDPASFGRLRESTNAETMGRNQVAQWNEALEDLRGETVKIGETWRVEDMVSMQGRPVPVVGVLRFAGWTEIDGLRGVKIEYTYDTTGEASAQSATEATRALQRRAVDNRGAQTNVSLHGSVTRVIVPESGQLLYEVKEETSEVPMGAMDGPRAVFTVRHNYRFRPVAP